MKRTIKFSLAITGIVILSSCSGNKLSFNLDLNQINNDRLEVSLDVPKTGTDTLVFSFPSVIPGHYTKTDYGRFISSVKAYNKKGDSLEINKSGINSWVIPSAGDLRRIRYLVDDTRDSEIQPMVLPWSATSFKKDTLFVLNNGGLFGFFEGREKSGYNIRIKIPENLYPSSGLEMKTTKNNVINISTDSYFEVIDNPILIARADTSSFFLDGTRVNIAAYNEEGTSVAEFMGQKIEDQLNAVKILTGGQLPVDQYTYLINLDDFTVAGDLIYNQPITMEAIGKVFSKLGRPMPGALEHNRSSYHHYLFIGKMESVTDLMENAIIHEFLHIFTPLSFHSRLTENFNYTDPEITKHIWMYEGVTEYLSGLSMLQGGLMPLATYLIDILRPKMLTGSHFPTDMKWTELSRNICKEPYKGQFFQFYEQGAVNAMMLDIEIIRLTNGKKNLKSVLFELVEDYGPEKPFEEDSLYSLISRKVDPGLMSFFKNHIENNEVMDYEKQLSLIGIGINSIEGMLPGSILAKAYGVEDVIDAFGFYTINEAKEGSIFRPGDKIKSSDFGYSCLRPFFDGKGGFIPETSSGFINVYRNREWIKIELKPEMTEGKAGFILYEIPDKSPEQEKFFQAWRY